LLNVQTPVPHSGFPELAIGKLWCEAGGQLATANVVSTISTGGEQRMELTGAATRLRRRYVVAGIEHVAIEGMELLGEATRLR
jgi:hypothetical protein